MTLGHDIRTRIFLVVGLLAAASILGAQIWVDRVRADCRDHCFPFASQVDASLGCWCADLGDTWHPDDW